MKTTEEKLKFWKYVGWWIVVPLLAGLVRFAKDNPPKVPEHKNPLLKAMPRGCPDERK